jgi:hypothetical protein
MNRGLYRATAPIHPLNRGGNEMPASNDHEQILDLKAEVCPYTFAKSKLQLETMEGGEVLI